MKKRPVRQRHAGERVGQPGSGIPDGGLQWIHIRPAVCLERWPFKFEPCSEAFTTISNWDSGDWVVDRDEAYKRRLWPALAKLASRFQPEQLAQVWGEHTKNGAHVSRTKPFPGWVPAEIWREAKALSVGEAEKALAPVLAAQLKTT